jgi:hypothetical protein
MNAINSMIGNQPLPLGLKSTAEDTTMKMNNRKIISDWCNPCEIEYQPLGSQSTLKEKMNAISMNIETQQVTDVNPCEIGNQPLGSNQH